MSYPRSNQPPRGYPPPPNQQQQQQQKYGPVGGYGSQFGPASKGPLISSGLGPNGMPAPVSGRVHPQDNYGSDASLVRKQEQDKLIHDCYSKYIVDTTTGRKIPEISYQTHINIKEYSQFPSHPPPDGIPASQLGSVKDRVLVICAKASGRVILQKGKFNEIKDAYQIGRTWDMDELKVISRTGNHGLSLTLNKEYYWRIDDGVERIWKFSRILAVAYGNFTGRYPNIVGWTISELKLPPSPPRSNKPAHQSQNEVLNEPIAHPELLKSKSIKKNHMPNPVLPQQPQPPQQSKQPKQPQPPQQSKQPKQPQQQPMGQQQSSRQMAPQQLLPQQYSDIDFTAQGKLPMKPMKQLQVDRAGSSTRIDQIDEPATTQPISKRNSHPYQAITSSPKIGDTSQDTHSFVFESSNNSQEKLQAYAREVGSNSPLRTYKQRKSVDEQKRKISETLDSVAAVGLQLGNQLNERLEDPKSSNRKSHGESPDFGIEEVEDDSDPEEDDDDNDNDEVEEEKPLFVRSNTNSSKIQPPLTSKISSSPEAIGEHHDSVSSSIQEIESFMESQLQSNLGNLNETKDDLSSTFALDYTNDSNLGLNILKKESNTDEVTLEKDPEIEDLLDEINWNISDDSDALIKKLTKELNRVKFKNVQEVIGLDFSSSSISSDLTTSLKEIENLLNIFKKMEVDFKLLAPEVQLIENNSEGLQVSSINKQTLLEELNAIVNNVSIHDNDLAVIENFASFDRLNKLEEFELRLSELHEALMTMKSSDDGLSSMKAVRQFKSSYQGVTDLFVRHFKDFIRGEFQNLVKVLGSDLDRISAHGLTRELNNILIYSGFMCFLKDVAWSDYQEINSYFNQIMCELFENLLSQKFSELKQTGINDLNVGVGSPTQSISNMKNSRSSRTLRLSTKAKFRLRSSETPDVSNASIPGSPSNTVSGSSTTANNSHAAEIHDSKAIIDLITFSKDLISIVQYFVGSMFHYDTNKIEYGEFLKIHPYTERRRLLDNPSFDLSKTYSNEINSNLTTIFGGYINIFMKKISPYEAHIPLILCHLEIILDENKSNNQEFLGINYLKRAIEKFQVSWSKSIKSRVESLNHSIIVAKSGVLPAVKNFSKLLLVTESSLDNSNYDIRRTLVREMIDASYQELIDACTHLFMRDDPLLKNSDFDEKEKQNRNISILQNIFYLTEQLSFYQNSSEGISKLKTNLDAVFKKIEDSYFKKLLQKNFGKLVEYVENDNTISQMGGKKSYNKKVVKSLISTLTNKEISSKAHEIYRKLEKHYISGGDINEKDLLERLWRDMEIQVTDYFERLGKIIRMNPDRDIDLSVTKQEIHMIFSQVH